MFLNYFRSIYRNLTRHKVFSLLNILGLTIGMAACLLILKYVSFEMSYDSFHEKKDEIRRLVTTNYQNGALIDPEITSGYAWGPTMVAEVPEILESVRFHPSYSPRIVSCKREDGSRVEFYEENIPFADSAFLDFFSFPLLKGNPQTALSAPSNILLSEAMVEKYFGKNSDPMGKTMGVNKGGKLSDYIVTGVFKNLPNNTHLKFDFLRSLEDVLTIRQYTNDDGWGWENFLTYVKVHPDVDTAAVNPKMEAVMFKHNEENYVESNSKVLPQLQPIADIHLNTDFDGELTPSQSKSTLYFFIWIAIAILLIAWVNYMNLSTARAIERAREVGIRKTVGAFRYQLIQQFLLESLVVNALAVGLAVVLAQLMLPVLSDLVGKDLSLTYQDNTYFWMLLVGLFLGGAFLSGVYPAFVLSSFNPVAVLKGSGSQKISGVSMRKILVVIQFAASVALITGTFAVYKQISLLKNKDMGMNLDQILVVQGPRIWDYEKHDDPLPVIKRLKEELLRNPSIKSISGAGEVPGGGYNWGTSMRKIGAPQNQEEQGYAVWVDYDFVETFGMKVIAGRTFSEEFKSDEEAVVINEACLKAFNLETAEEAILESIYLGGDTVKIVGVLKNFAWNSMREEFPAFVLISGQRSMGKLSFKVSPEDIPESIALIEKQYTATFPGNPFTYYFQDEFFNRQYKADLQFGNIFGLFTALAILVACLGLFGLSAFMVSRRIREIGIRKILGASRTELLVLLSKDFLALVGIAILVGLPLAFLGIHKWLDNYAHRISMDVWLFLVPALVVLLIAVLTVSFQTLRAARANPSDALRHE